MKRKLTLFLALLILCAVALCSCQGSTIKIGENGNWFINDEDTGVYSGGSTPTVTISDDGFWVINGEKTDCKALAADGNDGEDGKTPTVSINNLGYWVIDGKVTTTKALGTDGLDGATFSVISCEKTATSDDGMTDTYTFTFSDGSTTSFQISKSVDFIMTVKEIKIITENESVATINVIFSNNTEHSMTVARKSGANDTSIETAYKNASLLGYDKSFGEFAIESINKLLDKFGKSNSTISHQSIITVAAPSMLESYDEYFINETKAISTNTVPVEQSSGYVNELGKVNANSSTQSYAYSQLIEVSEFETVEFKKNSETVPLRFLTAYDKNQTAIASSGMASASMAITKYAVPSGIKYVCGTFIKSSTPIVAVITKSATAPSIKNDVTTQTILNVIKGESGGSTGSNMSSSDIINSAVLGATSICTTADTLTENTTLSLGENHIMNNKQLTLSFKIDELGEGESIRLGHGESVYGGNFLEITKTALKVYEYTTAHTLRNEFSHGLKVSGNVNVVIDVTYGKAKITISTSSGVYTANSVNWNGRNGTIFARCIGTELSDVKMRWTCSDLSKSIWLLGDSYFNSTANTRWTSYLVTNGYTNCLMSGYPGRNSASALADFKRMLEHGTPQYAVWCMGMNDADTDTAISSSYKAATEQFLAICNEKGITPILTTIPNVPGRNNTFKNEWVKSSGYRYVDFARAVGAEEKNSGWYDGMLEPESQGQVHPLKSGAEALYVQFITDFPEIMKKD